MLLAQSHQSSETGTRDRALLLFLYNTSTCVGEGFAVRAGDVSVERLTQFAAMATGRDRLRPL